MSCQVNVMSREIEIEVELNKNYVHFDRDVFVSKGSLKYFRRSTLSDSCTEHNVQVIDENVMTIVEKLLDFRNHSGR